MFDINTIITCYCDNCADVYTRGSSLLTALKISISRFKKTAFVFFMSLSIAYLCKSSMSYAVSSAPCRDIAALQQYVTERVPAEFWQDELFPRIVKYDEEKNYQAIRDEYQAALNAKPNSTYADFLQMSIGEAYAEMRDYAQALAVYEKFLENYPESVWREYVHYSIAIAHYKGGNFSQATSALQQVITNYPNSIVTACARQNLQSIESKQHPLFLIDAMQNDVDGFEGEVELYEQVMAGFELPIEELKSRIEERNITIVDVYDKVRENSYTEAFKIAEEFLKRYPDSDQIDSVYYAMVGTCYVFGDF